MPHRHAPSPAVQATLAAWQARADELAQTMCPNGVARPEDVLPLSGLEVFEAMFAGRLPGAPIARTMSFTLVEARRGHAVFQGWPRFEHYNPLGTVHGGWIATLLDSAVGCAVHTTLPAGKAYTTLELKVNYVKALTTRQTLVRAEGEVISTGARVATARGQLVGPDGTLYAHATTTCLIFDAMPGFDAKPASDALPGVYAKPGHGAKPAAA